MGVLGRDMSLISGKKRVWDLSHLLFAYDTVLGTHSERKLRRLVEEFGHNFLGIRNLNVNVGKGKVVKYLREIVVEICT